MMILREPLNTLVTTVWHYIIPHYKAVITESFPLENFFPHNYISKAIDDDIKRTAEYFGHDSC